MGCESPFYCHAVHQVNVVLISPSKAVLRSAISYVGIVQTPYPSFDLVMSLVPCVWMAHFSQNVRAAAKGETPVVVERNTQIL